MQQNQQKPQILHVNKLTNKSKKSFKQRTISSVFIIIAILVIFMCSVLNDNQWGWSGNLGLTVNLVFSFLQIAIFLGIAFVAAIEITNLFFYKNKVSLIVIFSLIAIFIISSASIFMIAKYNYMGLSQYDLFFDFLLVILGNWIFIFLVLILYFWMQGLLKAKYIFTVYGLVLLVSFFCIGWLYFASFKGWTTVLILYAITAATDVFAYIGGMLFGKQKLSPFISPNKTIAGAVIGVIGATAICCVFFIGFSQVPSTYNILGNFFGVQFKIANDTNFGIFASSPAWWITVIIILISLSCLSIVGDLLYSYIKRQYKIKDFSQLIPGHGGILDRIDSLSFVVPAYFIFITGTSVFSTTMSFF